MAEMVTLGIPLFGLWWFTCDDSNVEESTMARAIPIILSEDQRRELTRLIRSHSTPQQLARRARMIMLLADGGGVGETADALKVWRKGVSTWRARWLAAAP